MREKYCSAYLGIDRKILDYLPSNRWSLLGRILIEVNKKFELETTRDKTGKTRAKTELLRETMNHIRDKLLFTVKDDSGEEIMGKFRKILQEESARQLNRDEADFRVDLSLYDPWNFYKTLQLLVVENDMNGLEFQASKLGMGVQASISVAILRAYSEINLANKSPIFIDEPELFLHPQAQRNFYKILRGLSMDKTDTNGTPVSGTQVFFTTHSPNFLSAGSFNEIFLVRKNKDDGTHLKYAEAIKFIADYKVREGKDIREEDLLLTYRNAFDNTGNSQTANEGFFAKKIILVEGQSEQLLIPYFLDLLGFDYSKEGISIVTCGNKPELVRFFRLYSEFCIPCFVIFDGDKHLDGTPDKARNISLNKEILKLFGDDALDYPNDSIKQKYLGFEYELENNLGYSTTKKGLKLYSEVKEKIENGAITIPSWIDPVRKAVLALNDSHAISILES